MTEEKKDLEIMEKALAHMEKGQYYARWVASVPDPSDNLEAYLVGHWAGRCFAEREKAEELMRDLV